MVNMFIEDPPYIKQKFRGTIDYLGFGLMAIWLGTLQLLLDKGQEADWFEANWIRWITAASVVALFGFVARELIHRDPIVQLHVLGNRNFAVGTLITGLYGFVLYGVTAILPLFLQTLMGYPALDSGLAVSPRGIGSMLSMVVAGILARYVDGRVLMTCGFAIFGLSTLMLSNVNLGISMKSVAVPNLINGFAGGFVFVPLTIMAMGRLRKEEIGNASGIYNLVRNIGGSIGIACVTTLLMRRSQAHQSDLIAHVTAGSSSVTDAIRGLEARFCIGGVDAYTAHYKALGELYVMAQQQAALLAYVDNFRLLAFLALLCIPITFLFRRVQRHR
jgi:DHA2 family multidrug resistance protein